MRLPKTAHFSRPWRVHELTKDFKLEDVWELPTPGGPDDLARLVQQFTTSYEGYNELPVVPRALFTTGGSSESCSAGINTNPASVNGCTRCVSGCLQICLKRRVDRMCALFRGE